MDEPFDLLIRAGRVVCPTMGIDGPGAVAVRGDRITAVGADVSGRARATLEFPDGVLLPGLVDLHAHPVRGGSKFGVDPDLHMLPYGVTTVMSQGDAGAANWDQYRRDTIERSRTEVRLALNLARYGEATPGGCFENLAVADADACVRAVYEGDGLIWGIAVNTSVPSCGGSDPREVMRRALSAAEQAGCPLLVGLRRRGDWPLEEQLPLLRPGDVVTYCFSPGEESLVAKGRVRPVAWEARRRGVLFDVGHGMASFSFVVAEAAIHEGFLPDTISTDSYRRHLGTSPRHDLPRVLSKLIAAGMPEMEAFAAVTRNPARLLKVASQLSQKENADLVVLHCTSGGPALIDTVGETRPGGCWRPVVTVRAGSIVRLPDEQPGTPGDQ